MDATTDVKVDLLVHMVSPALLMALFGLVCYFQLHTHNYLFEDEPGVNSEEEENSIDKLTPLIACIIFVVTTLLVALCGDLLLSSIHVCAGETFAGTVILSVIIGGAQLLRSVMAAIRNCTSLVSIWCLRL